VTVYVTKWRWRTLVFLVDGVYYRIAWNIVTNYKSAEYFHCKTDCNNFRQWHERVDYFPYEYTRSTYQIHLPTEFTTISKFGSLWSEFSAVFKCFSNFLRYFDLTVGREFSLLEALLSSGLNIQLHRNYRSFISIKVKPSGLEVYSALHNVYWPDLLVE
jgi:hypothetical protein